MLTTAKELESVQTAEPIVIHYQQLAQHPSTEIRDVLQKALCGPDSLGLVAVRDIPQYKECRERLLPLAARLSALPEETLVKFEDPKSSYNVGWSCGKEGYTHGKRDIRKGSFFANPLHDEPAMQGTHMGIFGCDDGGRGIRSSDDVLNAYPQYTRGNIWPKEDLPELEAAFKELGKMMYDVGLMILRVCGEIVEEAARVSSCGEERHGTEITGTSLTGSATTLTPVPTIMKTTATTTTTAHPMTATNDGQNASSDAFAQESSTTRDIFVGAAVDTVTLKGRLLCYLPVEDNCGDGTVKPLGNGDHQEKSSELEDGIEMWCGWHKDHGSLTALTPAYFLDTRSGMYDEIVCPDKRAGLYVQTRNGSVVKVSLDRDSLAFQVGESLHALSGGILESTPHCVVATDTRRQQDAKHVGRCVLALFMQPHWDQPLESCTHNSNVKVQHWKPGITFGDFSAAKFAAYYSNA